MTDSVNLRKIQIDALKQIQDAIKKGKRHIFVDAPTGSGKSIIALELAKLFKEESYILTEDFFLQKQYEDSINRFGYTDIGIIASANQYTCVHNNLPVKTHGECVIARKSMYEIYSTLECSHQCHFFRKRVNTPLKKSVVTNYAYYLKAMNYTYSQIGNGKSFENIYDIYANYNPFGMNHSVAPFIPRKVMILDEAHKLPDQIQNAFAFSLNHKFLDDLYTVKYKVKNAKVSLDILEYVNFKKLRALIDNIHNTDSDNKQQLLVYLQEYKALTQQIHGDIIENTKNYIKHKWKPASIPGYIKTLLSGIGVFDNLYCKVDDYLKLIDKYGIINLIASQSDKNTEFNFLNETLITKESFHDYGKLFIYMSATIGNPMSFAHRLGLSEGDYAYIKVNPNWDFSKSPIYLCNGPSFKYNNKAASFKESVKIIKTILNKHTHDRGIIHTGTYEFAEYLEKELNDPRIVTYKGTKEKTSHIYEILNDVSNDNTILIGPSLFQGLDLPDDFLRFQIISKLQYPNVSNNLWKERFNNDELKYIYFDKPFIDVLQGIGRGNRNEDDYSTTYLIDGRFNKYLMDTYKFKFIPDNWKSRFKIYEL